MAQSATDWKLGVQLWTFHISSFTAALQRVDSCGLTYIEAYPGQKLGGDFQGAFGPSMSAADRQKLKALLQQKGISITAFGVVVVQKSEEWRSYFAFARDLNIPVITTEPAAADLDLVNMLAGQYHIRVAIHNHPRPSAYWHPDSVLKAMRNRPNIGVCADIGHWVRNGLNVVTCLQQMQGRIWGLHCKDVSAFGRKKAEDVLLGNGVCNIPGVLKELKRQHFKGFISIEHEVNWATNVQDVQYNVAYYKEHVGKLSANH